MVGSAEGDAEATGVKQKGTREGPGEARHASGLERNDGKIALLRLFLARPRPGTTEIRLSGNPPARPPPGHERPILVLKDVES